MKMGARRWNQPSENDPETSEITNANLLDNLIMKSDTYTLIHIIFYSDFTTFLFKSLEENRIDRERQKDTNKSWNVLRQSFLAEKRALQAESLQRHSWLPSPMRQSVKNRCRITHEVRLAANLRGLYSARYSETGKIIAVGFGSGNIQIRNGETGELEGTLKSDLESSMPIMCCRFNPARSEIFYASSACGIIFMCNTHTKEFSKFIFGIRQTIFNYIVRGILFLFALVYAEPKNEVNTIDVSIAGDYLVSGGKDAAVRLYNIHTTKLILMYKRKEESLTESKAINFHRMRIFVARFHKEYPDLILTGGWDDTVRIWDIRVPTGSVRIIRGPHICGDAIDTHETHILTGSWIVRDSLQVWDLTSAKLIETINPYNRPSTLNGEFLYVVQYLNEDPYGDLILAGGSGTGLVEVISLREKKVMGSFKVIKPIFAIDSYQTTIMFGGMESVLRLGHYNLTNQIVNSFDNSY
ncbi:PREDICTED: uncharacterized protein LOC105567672 [Vollenhovia emeryi]|uniref:uncharacterized protein LOC105567672 n=1 Tax=Vollenhovia emeryi TaxID=411798 RepID=UPI0005F49A2F|nr:PREDICTED: uncharacterized protein LOC105567672 [Vollenhovia emeryi]